MDYFNLKFHGAKVKNEVFAGVTLFITMSYILVVCPSILSQTGMPYDGVFLATVLVSGVTTIISAIYTKLPIALAPGIGMLTTFLALTQGDNALDYRVLLLATYVSGIVFLMLVKFGIYNIIMDIMDLEFRRMLMSGIGLALLIYGISTTGLLEKQEVLYTWGTIEVIPLLITAISLVLMFGMRKKQIKGHVLYGLLVAYVLGVMYEYYQNGYMAGVSLSDYFGNLFDWSYRFSNLKSIMFSFPDMMPIISDDGMFWRFVYIVFLFTMLHFFDAIGTNSSVFEAINLYIDERIKDDKSLEKAITIDGVGSVASGLFGISSVTTFAESLVGVISGGKTGVTALVTGICFLLCVLISPLFTTMPTVVAAPALIYVGIILTAQYRDFDKRKPLYSIFGVVLIIYLGLSFKIGAVVLYGLLGYTLLTAVVERKRPVKYWWIVLIFVCIQHTLQIHS